MPIPPFLAGKEFANVMPTDADAARLEYLTTTPDGEEVLHAISMYDVAKAHAILFRRMYGPDAPPRFQSVKGGPKWPWEYSENDILGQPVYVHNTTTKLETFVRLITDKMHRFLVDLYNALVEKDMACYAFKFRRFCGQDGTNVLQDAEQYIAKEIDDMIGRAMLFMDLDKCSETLSPQLDMDDSKLHRFLNTCPTNDTASRLEYILSPTVRQNTDGIYHRIRYVSIEEAPLCAFEMLWGRGAPERFQSFVRVGPRQTVHEVCRHRSDAEMGFLEKIYVERQKRMGQNTAAAKDFLKKTRAYKRPVDPNGLDKFLIMKHEVPDWSLTVRLVHMTCRFLEDLAITTGDEDLERFLFISNDDVEKAAVELAKHVHRVIADV